MEKNNDSKQIFAADKNNFVSLIDVNKYYEKNIHAVIDFNLNIKKNEFIVFVGPSGCGKSTTLRMIAGLEEISSGELYINGQYSNNLVSKDRDIAMVFQSYALYPNMTVFDNMAFSLKVRHFPKADIKQRVLEAAKILELEDYLDRKPKALSGGQRQRVALGRAIVRKARLFLMDEPLSNLDAKLRVQMRSKIIDIHNQIDATTIYVTHDQTEAMTMADRIVVMKKGIIQQVGTPFEIYRYPSNMFVASFIGSPAMNFIKSTYHDGTVILPDNKVIELNTNTIEKHNQFYQNRLAFLEAQLDKINIQIEKQNQNTIKNNKKSHSRESISACLKKDAEAIQKELNIVQEILHSQSHEIIFGIRPEAIEETTKDKPDFFEAKVEICELLGDEYFIHFTFGNSPILAKVPCKNTLWNKGDKILLRIVRHKIHLFDPFSTLTIV